MLKLPKGLQIDKMRAIYALKVTAAVILTLAIAFLFNLDHTWWALVTIPTILQPQAGAMVWRGAFRLGGTLVGSVIGLTFVSFFGQDGELLIAALAVYILLMGYLMRLNQMTEAYAYGVSGLTALIISVDAGQNMSQAFTYGLARTTETVIAIVSAFVVMLVVFPGSVSDTARRNLEIARQKTMELVRVALEGTMSPKESFAAVLALFTAHGDLDQLAFERTRRNWLKPRMAVLANALNRVALMADGARFAVERLTSEERSGAVEGARRQIDDLALAIPEQYSAADDARAHARRAAEIAETIHPQDLLGRDHEASLTDLRRITALYLLRQVASAMHQLCEAEAEILDPQGPAPKVRRVRARYHDRIAALQNGLRPALVLVTLSTYWFASAWSNGNILALVPTAITLLLGTIIPRKMRATGAIGLGQGFVIGCTLGLLMTALLQQLEGFFSFACIMGVVTFTLFYLAKSPTIPIGALIAIAVGFQPGNTQTYSPIVLINLAVVFAMVPVAFICAFGVFFPENERWLRRHLQRGTTSILRRAARERGANEDVFIGEAIDMLGDYGKDINQTDPLAQQLMLRARAALVVGVAMYRMRGLEAEGALPERLARFGPQVRAEVDKAIRSKSGRATSDVFAMVEAEILRLAAEGSQPETERMATLRYGGLVELIAAVMDRGSLACAKEAV
ncbi:FUSC family protein [Thioclava sp. BHET1]|nr:FUSC family protein [Thioclava sp. BHET1]